MATRRPSRAIERRIIADLFFFMDSYNARRSQDDAKGKFTADIVAGTDAAHQAVLAHGAVLRGHVDASDVPPQDQFPFFARAQQPRAPGVLDDNTRN